jgi:hypothetical protein
MWKPVVDDEGGIADITSAQASKNDTRQLNASASFKRKLDRSDQLDGSKTRKLDASRCIAHFRPQNDTLARLNRDKNLFKMARIQAQRMELTRKIS